MKPLAIYETADYFSTLLRLVAAAKPGGRVTLMSMSFDPREAHIASLVQELAAAAQRGVHVSLLVDAMTFATDAHDLPIGPAIWLQDASSARRPYFRHKYLLLESLLKAGGSYSIINLPQRHFANPYGGRSHIKLAVVDDTAFVGGCNLDDLQLDFMVRFEDPVMADRLYDFTLHVASIGSVRQTLHDTDEVLPLDEKTTILLDAGKPKQSAIYKQALDLIDTAENWLVMTCQYFPNTVTAEHLAAATKRGVHVTLYYNHPRYHAPHMKPVHRTVIQLEKMRRPRELFMYQLPKDMRRLHAKVLASERGAIIGSHNYVTHGVNFGTAEIAILRNDPVFAIETLAALRQQLPARYTKQLP